MSHPYGQEYHEAKQMEGENMYNENQLAYDWVEDGACKGFDNWLWDKKREAMRALILEYVASEGKAGFEEYLAGNNNE